MTWMQIEIIDSVNGSRKRLTSHLFDLLNQQVHRVKLSQKENDSLENIRIISVSFFPSLMKIFRSRHFPQDDRAARQTQHFPLWKIPPPRRMLALSPTCCRFKANYLGQVTATVEICNFYGLVWVSGNDKLPRLQRTLCGLR